MRGAADTTIPHRHHHGERTEIADALSPPSRRHVHRLLEGTQLPLNRDRAGVPDVASDVPEQQHTELVLSVDTISERTRAPAATASFVRLMHLRGGSPGRASRRRAFRSLGLVAWAKQASLIPTVSVEMEFAAFVPLTRRERTNSEVEGLQMVRGTHHLARRDHRIDSRGSGHHLVGELAAHRIRSPSAFALLATLPGLIAFAYHCISSMPRFRARLDVVRDYGKFTQGFDTWWLNHGWPRKLQTAGYPPGQPNQYFSRSRCIGGDEDYLSFRPMFSGALWGTLLLTMVFLIAVGVAKKDRHSSSASSSLRTGSRDFSSPRWERTCRLCGG